jgi:mannose-6-phosphate isomerase-like protein (cupin superfamily)
LVVDGLAIELDKAERLEFSGATILVRASGATTDGAFALFEEVPPLIDTPLHVHEREDEYFFILEGEHVFQVGDETFQVGPGAFVAAPRGVPHSQRRVAPGEGRQLVMTSPAGFEGFFRDLAEAARTGTLGPDAYANVSQKYGLTWVDQ